MPAFAATCSVDFANEMAGLTRVAAAAALNNCAKLRREIEIVFIPAIHRTIRSLMRDRIMMTATIAG